MLVMGVGINTRDRPSNCKEYKLWGGILERCYSSRSNKNYETCTVSDNFLNYTYFFDWCQVQAGFGLQDFDLDKDLLSPDSKQYSELNCVFIPSIINKALVKNNAPIRDLPLGVTRHGKGFRATIRLGTIRKHLGSFECPFAASKAYNKAKLDYLKEAASKYRELIDERAYNALMNYTLLI